MFSEMILQTALFVFFLSLHFSPNALFAVGNFLSSMTRIHLLFDQRCVTSLNEGVFVLSGALVCGRPACPVSHLARTDLG